MTNFARAADVQRHMVPRFRSPDLVAPSDSAARSLRNDKGQWDPLASPMMVEPLDLLASRRYTGIVYVGPARTGKTYSLIHGGISYAMCCAPGDSLVTQMSQDSARDFSRNEVDRVIRYSPGLSEQLSPRARDDNTFDKHFRSGVSLKIGWPAISQLSSKTLRYVFLTDYDRPENRDNVDGEGAIWDLAAKRVQTFMSRGKCLAESSPGEELKDLSWRPATPHEAPNVPGILSLYNRGTRARWYWPCKHCDTFFEAKPGLENFSLPPFEELEKLVLRADLMSIATSFAHIACPSCGGLHEIEDKHALNARGRWVHEGEAIKPDGTIVGERRGTLIASYWQGGASATYQRWDHLLLAYLQGILTYTRSGDESGLKSTTLTDQAAVYISRAHAKRRAPEDLMSRVDEWPQGVVPSGVLFLTAAVDVQSNRFVVQVEGWGANLECWIVDRFNVSASTRKESETRFAAINPAAFKEDWDVLLEEVIRRTYPLESAPEKRMAVRLTMNDSGGADGVTINAYDFWRKVKRLGVGHRYQLVRGHGNLNAPPTKQTFPVAPGRVHRHGAATGDVPVWALNVNVLKDAVAGELARTAAGPGYVHFPAWLDASFFSELTAETRGAKGWERQGGKRNESLDLHVYNRAACLILRADQIDWTRPPAWIAEQIVTPGAQPVAKVRSLADLARGLNG